jgi:hypothetical protein
MPNVCFAKGREWINDGGPLPRALRRIQYTSSLSVIDTAACATLCRFTSMGRSGYILSSLFRGLVYMARPMPRGTIVSLTFNAACRWRGPSAARA